MIKNLKTEWFGNIRGDILVGIIQGILGFLKIGKVMNYSKGCYDWLCKFFGNYDVYISIRSF